MSSEMSARPDYRPVQRGSTGVSHVRRIMDLRSAAVLDRARISAEIGTAEHAAHEHVDAAYDLAEHVVARARRLDNLIQNSGNDPELRQMHSYIKGGATESVINLMQGPADGDSS